MACNSCRSDRQRVLTGEIALHFPGLKGLEKPVVWVFPQVAVCLNCGSAEFQVDTEQLKQLDDCDAERTGFA